MDHQLHCPRFLAPILDSSQGVAAPFAAQARYRFGDQALAAAQACSDDAARPLAASSSGSPFLRGPLPVGSRTRQDVDTIIAGDSDFLRVRRRNLSWAFSES